MDKNSISISNFNTNIFSQLNEKWMLLTAGDYHTNNFNTMTVSWGFMGTFWGKPMVTTGVRPQRHTMKFIEEFDTFTLCAFPDDHKDILSFCGSKSGRDVNKVAECGLTPISCDHINAPTFEQAELTIECKKVYSDSLKGKNFLDKTILESCYKERDFHTLFFGEVINIKGVDRYKKKKNFSER